MYIVDQIPGFIAGGVVSAVVSFFVWRNNPALMDSSLVLNSHKAEERVKWRMCLLRR